MKSCVWRTGHLFLALMVWPNIVCSALESDIPITQCGVVMESDCSTPVKGGIYTGEAYLVSVEYTGSVTTFPIEAGGCVDLSFLNVGGIPGLGRDWILRVWETAAGSTFSEAAQRGGTTAQVTLIPPDVDFDPSSWTIPTVCMPKPDLFQLGISTKFSPGWVKLGGVLVVNWAVQNSWRNCICRPDDPSPQETVGSAKGPWEEAVFLINSEERILLGTVPFPDSLRPGFM